MGDFNARVGLGVDFDGSDIGEDLLLQSTGTAPVIDINPRCSTDTAPPNRLGEALLHLCVVSGLIIMNGRTHGDMHGATTFYADGMDRKSVIDYVLASPDILNSPGVSLLVTPKHDCPLRPGGKKFDHMPITTCIPAAYFGQVKDMPTIHTAGTPTSKHTWRDAYSQKYMSVMKSDPEVKRLLKGAAECTLVAEAEAALGSALAIAMNKCIPVGRRSPTTKRNHGPMNAWYDDECKIARQAARQAERLHGSDSLVAGVAHKQYKGTLRRKKRKWLETNMENLQIKFRRDPKSFWNDFQGPNRAASSDISLSEWTSYFTELLDTQVDLNSVADAGGFISKSDGPHSEAAPTWLCQTFTPDEVFGVLQSLRKNSSPGVDGIPAEWYRFATHESESLFVQALTNLFNLIWKSSYPSQWAASALVPVPKPKGSIHDKDDYRGIAVSNSIGKIFSLCMLHRLDDWAEEFNLRASGQYGFRKGRGTADATFVLNHLIDQYRESGKPLFVAFVDFKKAYDWVNRDLLWDCLEKLGVKDPYLSILKSMYDQVVLQVRLDGKLGLPFPSLVGVKQGDPLSPLLFGLFIDRIEAFLKSKLPNIGAKLMDKIIQLLLYADDLALMAEQPDEMQALLDCLKAFCEATKLTVSIKKSEVVLFNKQFCTKAVPESAKFTYDGIPLKATDTFIYLGSLQLDDDSHKRAKEASSRMLTKAPKAYHKMNGRCHSMELYNISILTHLFDALVRPILNFGCEVWGPSMLTNPHITNNHAHEKWHRKVLKRMVGVCTSTASNIIMEELDRVPLCFDWLKQALRFWNKTVDKDVNDLCRMALEESFNANTGWVHDLRKALMQLGSSVHLNSIETIDVEDILSEVTEAWRFKYPNNTNAVRDIPDECRAGFKRIRYQKWFAPVRIDNNKVMPFTYALHRRDQVRIVAQFRMGSHWLNSERMRLVNGIYHPRSLRHCQLCELNKLEDERHIFECPFYNNIRLRFQNLFTSTFSNIYEDNNLVVWNVDICDMSFKSFMNGNNTKRFWRDLANYLLSCRKTREEALNDLLRLN